MLTVDFMAETAWRTEFIQKYSDDPKFAKFDFLDDDDTTKLVQFAGRVCYMSFEKPRPGGVEAYIENILKVGHGSVLEHANFTFWLQGVSRTLTHELVRHRAGWAYSQLSQRFVDGSNAQMVIPPLIEGMEAGPIRDEVMGVLAEVESNAKVNYGQLQTFLEVYDSTLTKKQVNEVARCVLPNMTETKIVFTANARALRHFFEMRGALGADAEIRQCAIEVWQHVKTNLMFKDFHLNISEDGKNSYLENTYKKV